MFLLCESWLHDPQGSLPDCKVTLMEMARVTEIEWATIWPIIEVQFERGPDGLLHNVKLRRIKDIQDIRRECGRKGGEVTKAICLGKTSSKQGSNL